MQFRSVLENRGELFSFWNSYCFIIWINKISFYYPCKFSFNSFFFLWSDEFRIKSYILNTCWNSGHMNLNNSRLSLTMHTQVTWRLISLTKELNHRCFHQRLPTSAGGEDIRVRLVNHHCSEIDILLYSE